MSNILKQSRDEAEALFKLKLITVDQYNEMMRLTARDIKIPAPKKYDGKKIQRIREKLHCSQKVFADIVGVTADTISKWERNVRSPDKIACRFLKMIERDGLGVL
jgi:putative transcriptional regulator